MIKLLDNTRISWFNYFYIFCMFIYAGSATVFARGLGEIDTMGNAFALLITVFFYLSNRVRFTKAFFVPILVFLLYAVATSIKNRMINPRWITEWIIWLTIAYGICHGLKKKLFIVVETVLYHLCLIALAFWIVHLINPELIETVVKTLEFSQPYAEDCNVWANMIVYTVDDVYQGDYAWSLRNAGFAWEPGAFACFACMGIFCNTLRYKGLTLNRSLTVFFLALLSSQSTTGFSILLVMLVLWIILNKKYSYLLFLIPAVVLIYKLPFVNEKLMEEFYDLQNVDYREMNGPIGRFYSLQLSFEEFLRHPIIGLGGYASGTWLAQHRYDVITISGIGHILVYFGSVMSLLFLISLIKSCKCIQEITKSNYAWLLMVVLVGTMFSYDLWEQPIYIAFWMYCLYNVGYHDGCRDVDGNYGSTSMSTVVL